MCFPFFFYNEQTAQCSSSSPSQVNHSPSFHTDAPLDKEVKEGLLFDTLNLVDLYANDKRKCEEEDRRRVQERLLNKHKSKETRSDNSYASWCQCMQLC